MFQSGGGAIFKMQEVGTSSIAPLSPRAMDETTRGRLAQAIRDAFTSSGIDYNEDYIDSLISKVDDDGMWDI